MLDCLAQARWYVSLSGKTNSRTQLDQGAPTAPLDVQAVKRIVAIIEKVGQSPSGMTLSEIALATGLSPATCHRLLKSLSDEHLVERELSSKRYRSGIGLIRLAASVNPTSAAGPSADVALTALRDRWQECFFVTVLADENVICVHSVETTNLNRMAVHVPLGRQLSVQASASSRAILAFASDEVRDRVLAQAVFEAPTSFTRSDRKAVLEELEETRKRGYAICDQELEIGVVAFGAPIYDLAGGTPRSISVVGPRERLFTSMAEGLIDDLTAAARYLSGLEPRAFVAARGHDGQAPSGTAAVAGLQG